MSIHNFCKAPLIASTTTRTLEKCGTRHSQKPSLGWGCIKRAMILKEGIDGFNRQKVSARRSLLQNGGLRMHPVFDISSSLRRKSFIGHARTVYEWGLSASNVGGQGQTDEGYVADAWLLGTPGSASCKAYPTSAADVLNKWMLPRHVEAWRCKAPLEAGA